MSFIAEGGTQSGSGSVATDLTYTGAQWQHIASLIHCNQGVDVHYC